MQKPHKVPYGLHQFPGLGQKDIGREFLFPDGNKAVIIATELGQPIRGYLIGCSCTGGGKCYPSRFPRSWEHFTEMVGADDVIYGSYNNCWLALVPVGDPRANPKVLTRRDLASRPGVVFKYLANGDGTTEKSHAYFVPVDSDARRPSNAHPEMPERMDGRYISVADSKAEITYNRPVVVCWDPVTKWEPEYKPAVVEPLPALFDKLTAAQCLVKYERLMQLGDASELTKVRAIKQYNGDILDPKTAELLLTSKQYDAAKVAWSLALKAKVAALKETDRMQVTCEDQYEL